MKNYLFTSESVSEGHPDKMCDQISDAILDMHLKKDPNARVAVETLVKTGLVVVAGEISTNCKLKFDYQEKIREVITSIGYDNTAIGFDGNTCGIIVAIEGQSEDISLGVDGKEEQGAGDQGMMFGYACNETPELMPMSIQYSHNLLKEYAVRRKSGSISWARPDAKAQVTVRYENDKPVEIDTIVMSAQHDPDASQELIHKDLMSVISKVVPEAMIKNTTYHFNPTGRFVTGGPVGDCGLTGRKIIVDTYGGHGSHGGGAFSGKDPSKVDRSAAYAARYIAKNIVAAKLADKCMIQLAYAIGVPKPVSVCVETYNTGKISDEHLSEIINEVFPLKPADIIDSLNLKNINYQSTAAYGHFGRAFTWEKTDKVEELLEIKRYYM